MHSVTIDRSASPKKRTLSRGISEDESLRIIIKESESSPRRLARCDSRGGTLKRKSESQSNQDLSRELPEVMELQTSYEEVIQELRGMEVERETLLFQVDVLQDTLEGVEELLAEAQREARHANTELEHERVAKKKLEGTVRCLMIEVERLKEENATVSARHPRPLGEGETTLHKGPQYIGGLSAPLFTKGTGGVSSVGPLDTSPLHYANVEPSGEPTESGEVDGVVEPGSPLDKLQKMVTITLGQMTTLALDEQRTQDGVLRRPCEGHLEDGGDADSVSAYEDASADTPELEKLSPGDSASDNDSDAGEMENEHQVNESGPENESCILS